MYEKDGLEIFACWILILQVASKCNPRGSLIRNDGSPLDIQSIMMKTRVARNKHKVFERAINLILQIGWIERVKCKSGTRVTPECQASAPELNRIELNRIEDTPLPPKGGSRTLSIKDKKIKEVDSNDLIMIQIGSWLNRPKDELWTIYESELLEQIKPTPDQLKVLEKFYTADLPRRENTRRKKLVTLLTHWKGELDKARVYCKGREEPDCGGVGQPLGWIEAMEDKLGHSEFQKDWNEIDISMKREIAEMMGGTF